MSLVKVSAWSLEARIEPYLKEKGFQWSVTSLNAQCKLYPAHRPKSAKTICNTPNEMACILAVVRTNSASIVDVVILLSGTLERSGSAVFCKKYEGWLELVCCNFCQFLIFRTMRPILWVCFPLMVTGMLHCSLDGIQFCCYQRCQLL